MLKLMKGKIVSTQNPTIGRIVHYTPIDEETTCAAIITGIKEDMVVNLCVFAEQTMFFVLDSEYSEDVQGGCWRWPPIILPPPIA